MSTTFQYRIAGFSEQHTRPYNEDRIYPDPTTLPSQQLAPLCLAVADGMGGTQQGEQAAIAATQSLPELQTQLFAHQPLTTDTVQTTLRHHYQALNQRIIDHAGGPGVSGSTLSLLVFTDQHFWLGHLGDSRVYLWRNQQLHALTTDDNAFGSLVRQGHVAFHPQQCQLTPEDRDYLNQHQLLHSELFYVSSQPIAPNQLSQQLHGKVATLHQQGYIKPVGATRERLMWALGKAASFPAEQTAPALPHGISNTVQTGDLFLLCTDGLHGVFSHATLETYVRQIAQRLSPTNTQDNLLAWGCDMLLQQACDAGSNDNISLLLVQPVPVDTPQTKEKPPTAVSQPLGPPPTTAAPAQRPQQQAPVAQAQPSLPPLKQEALNEIAPPQIHPRQDSFVLETSEVDSNESWTRWLKDYRVLYVVIAALVALLLIRPAPTSAPIVKKPTQRPTLLKKSGPSAFLRVKLPATANQPMVKQRLMALREFRRDIHTVTTIWQLPTRHLEPLQRALQAPPLGYKALQQRLNKVPMEAHHWSSWDRAFTQSIDRLVEAIAPKYQSYLDELSYKLSLPHLSVAWKLSATMQQSYRKRLVEKWGLTLQQLRIQSWKLSLLQERLRMEDAEPSRNNLRQGLKMLQQAHQALRAQDANHTLLPSLSNRIQLYQAHLKKTKP